MFERRGFFKKAALMVAGVFGVAKSPKDIGKDMLVDEIIESMPNIYKELARIYLPVIKRMRRWEVILWVDHIIGHGGEINAAWVRKMKLTIPKPELVVDQDRLNEILKALNKHFTLKVSLDQHVIRIIVAVGIDKIHNCSQQKIA